MRSLALLALLCPAIGAQATLHVPADYGTIQEAIDAAQAGDTVQIAAGVFYEHIHLKEDVIVAGSGWRQTILDGNDTGDVVTADGIHNFKLTKLTLRGSKTTGGNPGAGVLINGSESSTFGVTASVERCRILDNGDGIRVTNVHSGTLTIDQNIIDRNARDGISLHIGTTRIRRNSILHNGGNGILANGGSGLVDLRSNVIGWNGGHAMLRQQSTPTLIAYNSTHLNAEGDYGEVAGGPPALFAPQPGTGEITGDPGMIAPENGDYHLLVSSPLIDGGDPTLGLDPDSSAPEIGAYAYLELYFPNSVNHGTDCGPVSGWWWEPLLGQPYYELHLRQAPALSPAVMLVGVSSTSWSGLPLPFDLGFFGATDCWLLTGPITTLTTLTDGDGEAIANIPIPDDPVLIDATLQLQWAVVSGGANPLGMLFSDAVAATIKP